MPTKPNRAGKPQNYVPAGNGDASGEYGNHSGSNKHFTNFSKDSGEKGFNDINKKRMGAAMSAQIKQAPVKAAPVNNDDPADFDTWAKTIMTQERVGNPPEPLKIRVKDTPTVRINDEDIVKAKKEFKPETVDRAVNLLRKYEQTVDETAADLEKIADSKGGLMIGMEFRLKRLGSMSRKLESYVIEEHANGNTNFTIDDAVGKMRDVARFTMCFDEKNFEGGVKDAINELNQQGYKMVRAKNTFVEGAGYKGLNCNFMDKQGNIFELQFHVPASMKIKEGIEVDLANKAAVSDRTNVTAHDIYEKTRVIEDKMRSNTATPNEKQLYNALMAESQRRWNTVPNYNLDFLK